MDRQTGSLGVGLVRADSAGLGAERLGEGLRVAGEGLERSPDKMELVTGRAQQSRVGLGGALACTGCRGCGLVG